MLLEKHGVTLETTAENKSGQRRSKFYRSILDTLDLPDAEETFRAYRELTEVISASGLCIFAVAACLSTEYGSATLPVSDRLPRLLQSSTGILFRGEDLLTIAAREKQL